MADSAPVVVNLSSVILGSVVLLASRWEPLSCAWFTVKCVTCSSSRWCLQAARSQLVAMGGTARGIPAAPGSAATVVSTSCASVKRTVTYVHRRFPSVCSSRGACLPVCRSRPTYVRIRVTGTPKPRKRSAHSAGVACSDLAGSQGRTICRSWTLRRRACRDPAFPPTHHTSGTTVLWAPSGGNSRRRSWSNGTALATAFWYAIALAHTMCKVVQHTSAAAVAAIIRSA